MEEIKHNAGIITLDYIDIDWENTQIPTDVLPENPIYVSISSRTYDPEFLFDEKEGGNVRKAPGFWAAPTITKSKEGMFNGPVSDWDAWKTSESYENDYDYEFEYEGKQAIYIKPNADTIFIRPSLYKDFLAEVVDFCECNPNKKMSVLEKRKFMLEMFKSKYPQFARAKHLVLKIDCLEDIFSYDAIFNPKKILPKYKRMVENFTVISKERFCKFVNKYLEILRGEYSSDASSTDIYGFDAVEGLYKKMFGMFTDYNEFFENIYKKVESFEKDEDFYRFLETLRRYPEYIDEKSSMSFLFGLMGIQNDKVVGAMEHEFCYFSGLELTKKGCLAAKALDVGFIEFDYKRLDEETLKLISYQRNLKRNRTKCNGNNLRNFFTSYDVPSLVIFDGEAVQLEREEVIHYTDEYKRNGYMYDLWYEEEQKAKRNDEVDF